MLRSKFIRNEILGWQIRNWRALSWREFVLRIALPLAFAWADTASAAPVSIIAIILSDDSVPYRETVSGIRSSLDTTRTLVTVYSLGGKKLDFSSNRPDLIISVGVRATQDIAEQHLGTPMLATLIPRRAFEKIKQQSDYRKFSALYLDQPLARQIDLIRIVFPDRTRIGVVLGPESEDMQKALQLAANDAKYGLTEERITAENELLPALQRVFAESDVMLTLPDPMVFNKGTAQGLLLTSYRYRNPVIGFSQAYVKAGALAAVYTTPEQTGKQAGEVVMRALEGKIVLLPPPQYPKYYSVSVNYMVARSLGIHVNDEADILQQLQHR